jgi:WD40 repeat protein
MWDLTGTTGPRVFTGHARSVLGVAVSADGQTAVSGGIDGTVRVWDLAQTAEPRVFTSHTRAVLGVAVSADGQTAVSGSEDGTVRVWDLAGNREQARWITDADVRTIAFNTAITVAGDIAGQVHALQLNLPAAEST